AITNELFARLQKRADMSNSNPPATSVSGITPSKMKESNPPTTTTAPAPTASKVQFGPNIDSEPAAEIPPTSPGFSKRASTGFSKTQIEKKSQPPSNPEPPQSLAQTSNPSLQQAAVDDSEKDTFSAKPKTSRSGSGGPSSSSSVTKEDL